MGYTHYWEIPFTTSWRQSWPQLIQDTRLIIRAAGVRLSGSGIDADEDDQPQVNDKGIILNGYGDDSHEPFILECRKTRRSFCKTASKEYDIVVTAILLRASQLAGDAIEVRSDGNWDYWKEARELVKKLWPDEEVRCPWVEGGNQDF